MLRPGPRLLYGLRSLRFLSAGLSKKDPVSVSRNSGLAQHKQQTRGEGSRISPTKATPTLKSTNSRTDGNAHAKVVRVKMP
ncbi:hypothetical protein Nepgr_029319 [Nepenthes gracilis]|uniref:Uncharacterized protein n=1 Tax=Nepenthes gracilis TaxID=150966 RepID=A0AAD3TDY1_NEPGR|nr:hypothetical protein Nepgr_029319 [Nepenthes gracilis]